MRQYFEQATRTDGASYWRLIDADESATGAPDWLRDAVYEAHDDEFPNDWRYETCVAIADAIDNDNDEEFDAWRTASELADEDNGSLAAWLAGNNGRFSYCDEEIEESGSFDTLYELLQAGQHRCIRQMADVLYAARLDAEQPA